MGNSTTFSDVKSLQVLKKTNHYAIMKYIFGTFTVPERKGKKPDKQMKRHNEKTGLRKRIFDIIQIGNKEDLPSRVFDYFIVTVIILNILIAFLDTFDELSPLYHLFTIVEIFTIAVFIIEYSLRIWTSDYLFPECSKSRSVFKFLFSFDGIVDLLTILPFFFLDGFIVFRMLRVVRIFRLFKVNAQYDSFNIITNVLSEKKNQIASSVFIIFTLMLASSIGMYGAEHEVQPDVYKNAFSGIWWSVSALLTVGYGDIYPVTVAGKIMGILTAFLGVGVVAIPTGIISAGFVEQYTKKQNDSVRFNDIKEVGEILVTDKNKLCGMTINEVKDMYEIKIYVLIRDDLTVIPADNVVLKNKDILIVNTKRLVKK